MIFSAASIAAALGVFIIRLERHPLGFQRWKLATINLLRGAGFDLVSLCFPMFAMRFIFKRIAMLSRTSALRGAGFGLATVEILIVSALRVSSLISLVDGGLDMMRQWHQHGFIIA